MTWPPNVTLKKHARARHIKLKASVQHGLELVVPKRFNPKEIPFILEQNRIWIEKQLLKIQSQFISIDKLPNEIIFSAINLSWQIEYIASDMKLKLLSRPHQRELVFIGDIQNKLACKKLLIIWVKKQARIYLLNQLEEVSQQIRLSYTHAIIRDQSTRWGSCSSKKSISLNYKLLFLPFELMRHVLIHELCHTVHLNHSDAFWGLVERFDPKWEQHRRELRKADKLIPMWLK